MPLAQSVEQPGFFTLSFCRIPEVVDLPWIDSKIEKLTKVLAEKVHQFPIRVAP